MSPDNVVGEDRNSALQITGQLRLFFTFNGLNTGAFQLKEHCSTTALGFLGLIGTSLKYEFPEPRLSEEDVEEIVNSLKKIRELVKNTSLPADLVLSLLRNIDSMIFWLTQPDMVCMQDLFEQSGTALLLAKQIEESSTDQKSDPRTRGTEIKEILAGVMGKIGTAVKFAVHNSDKIAQLEHVASDLLK